MKKKGMYIEQSLPSLTISSNKLFFIIPAKSRFVSYLLHIFEVTFQLYDVQYQYQE